MQSDASLRCRTAGKTLWYTFSSPLLNLPRLDHRALSRLDAKLGEALLREEISSFGEQSPLTRLRVPLDEGIDPGDCYNMCAYEKGYAFVCYLRSLVRSDQVRCLTLCASWYIEVIRCEL